jgi:hypothetical protein
MLQRTIAICVFTFFILGTVSQSQAGGFLQRLRGKACSGRLAAWHRHCPTPSNACQATPRACSPTVSTYCSPSNAMSLPTQASTGENCNSQYLANCEICKKVYEGDPKNQAECLIIACKVYLNCIRSPQPCALPGPCQCLYVEDPTGQSCMETYLEALNLPGFRECAGSCYFICLSKIVTSNESVQQSLHPVGQ